MVGSADLILFGIRSAIKLAQAGRDIYREDTQGRRIVLPLPTAMDSPLVRAREYAEFLENEQPQRYEKFKQAHSESYSDDSAKKQAAIQALIELYLYDLGGGFVKTFSGDYEMVAAQSAIKAWAAGDLSTPLPIQRAAGVLVEIAVDYFANTPGALADDTPQARSLKALLSGLAEVNFQETRWDAILISVFTTAIDTVANSPDLLSEDEIQEKILKDIISGVGTEMTALLEKLPPEGDPDAENRIKQYGQLVLRSLLRNAVPAALKNPGFVRVGNEADVAMLKQVSSVFISLLLSDTEANGGYNLNNALKRTASTEGMQKLILAAVNAAGEYPEIFRSDDATLNKWIGNVLTGIYQGHTDGEPLFHADIFPEIAYLAIDYGLKDLGSLLPVEDTRQAMLVSVIRQVFEATATGDGKRVHWKFDLSESEAKKLFSSVLSSFVQNPNWISKKVEKQRAAAPLIKLAVEIISSPGPDLLKNLIQTGKLEIVLSAVLSSGILSEMDDASAKNSAAALQLILSMVEGQGLSNIEEVLKDHRLSDLLKALAGNNYALKKLFGENTDEMKKVATGLAEILTRMRKQEVLSIEEMADIITKSSGSGN